MKPYLLFTGDNNYPNGGWGDYVADYDTIELAMEKKDLIFSRDWWEIVKIDEEQPIIVKSGSYGYR